MADRLIDPEALAVITSIELNNRQRHLVAELVKAHAARHANRRIIDWSYDMAPDSSKEEWRMLAEEWQEIAAIMEGPDVPR